MVSRNEAMIGKICMVTGATSGIGKVTARALAEQGATVIVVGRDPARSDATVRETRQQTGNDRVECLLADLSSMQQVRDLAAQFKRHHDRLHVLVNNAGAIFMMRHTSADGLEMTFALNHLGYFLLTNLLLDVITVSAPARIVNVSSAAHVGMRLNFDHLQHRGFFFNGYGAYGQSKLMNLLFTYELARRLDGTGVTVNALHPGFVRSRFFSNNWGVLGQAIWRVIGLAGISPEQGAQTSIYLATSPEVEGVTGQYFARCKPVRSSHESYDEEAQRRLWRISAELTGLDNRDPAM
jgi:NAD(P)-dependent dehydrogenase (short-subunit alcohol dehydrogenase family)